MIEVIIDSHELSMRARSGLMTEMRVLSICREAGIPVKGVFFFKGVERGLMYWEELQFEKTFRIRWYDEGEVEGRVGSVYERIGGGEGDDFKWDVFKKIGEK